MSRATGKSAAAMRRTIRRAAAFAERHHSRFRVSLPVRCSRVTGRAPRAWRGRTANVGGGGLAVDLPTRIPPRSRITVEIRAGIGPLRMEADVLWTRGLSGEGGRTRHGLCLAGGSEVMDLPLHALLGRWPQRLARQEARTLNGEGGRRLPRARGKTRG